MAQTAPFQGIRPSLGYEQITTLTSSTPLNIPAGTALIIVTPQAQAVRWRDDGGPLSATVGYPLAVGAELRYDSRSMAALRFIEQTASAAINVVYYGAP